MLALLLGLVLLSLACDPAERKTAAGAVVESVTPGGAGARAGLRPGDALVSVRSCVDLADLETEQAPRGPVTLRVRRAGKLLNVEMPPGAWGLQVESNQTDSCTAFARARREEEARRWGAASAILAGVARRARQQGDARLAALALQKQGATLVSAEDLAGAERALEAALRLRRQTEPGGLAEAAVWHALGRLAQRRGEIARSDAAFHQALALRTRLAPESLERSWTLNNLGINAAARGDFTAARRYYEQALALTRRRAPGSLDEAQVLNNLGLLARTEGDAAAARRWFAAAVRIGERFDPASLDLARYRTSLGLLALDRGDLAQAEEALQGALDRFEATAPESVEVATLLNALGSVARDRFAYEEADTLFRRALALRGRLVPGSAGEAESLSSLAGLARDRGRLDEAERYARRALAIRSRIAPEGQEVIVSLAMLGAIAESRGDLATAIALCERALARQRKTVPGARFEGDILQFLGEVSLQRGEWGKAEEHLGRALALRRRLEPASRSEAETLDLLGQLYEKTGRIDAARQAFAASVDALEAQVGRVGGSDEALSSFQAGGAKFYWDLLAFQVRRGDTAAALHTLERSRARSLLTLLAQRDLAFGADLPAPLLEQQSRLEREYEAVQEDLALADPRNTAELDALRVRLIRLRGERSGVAARIARASPHYAALRYPQPLDLPGVRRALDPGTVLLSYCVTEEETFLFVVTPEGAGAEPLRAVRIPAGRKQIVDEVAVFRSLLLRGRDAPAVEEALLAQGRKLYQLLVAPAAPAVEAAERVLISPDGPLHTLPFSALVRPMATYLAGWRPIHTVLSATLYEELRRGRRERRDPGPFVVFADPLYRPAPPGTGDAGKLPLARYRRGLTPLPAARDEARTLARLYGGDALVYTGALATEERAKRLPAAPRALHFATHALLDVRSPLDSALALAVPGREGGENGLLQAWEIFEQVRIDADLVTLSACETGLGKEAAGEGLIGLTRAFQYAGARSVLASLWAVSDRSTAELMERFYAGLRAGKPKDAALAEAQRGLLRADGALAHPYHWAAFELTGDWR